MVSAFTINSFAGYEPPSTLAKSRTVMSVPLHTQMTALPEEEIKYYVYAYNENTRYSQHLQASVFSF